MGWAAGEGINWVGAVCRVAGSAAVGCDLGKLVGVPGTALPWAGEGELFATVLLPAVGLLVPAVGLMPALASRSLTNGTSLGAKLAIQFCG